MNEDLIQVIVLAIIVIIGWFSKALGKKAEKGKPGEVSTQRARKIKEELDKILSEVVGKNREEQNRETRRPIPSRTGQPTETQTPAGRSPNKVIRISFPDEYEQEELFGETEEVEAEEKEKEFEEPKREEVAPMSRYWNETQRRYEQRPLAEPARSVSQEKIQEVKIATSALPAIDLTSLNPDDMRYAIILSEILGPPVSVSSHFDRLSGLIPPSPKQDK